MSHQTLIHDDNDDDDADITANTLECVEDI